MPRVFEARYTSGDCGLCDESIVQGQDVCYLDDELCHAECAEEEGEELVYE